ncbi:MAG: hypothetical protein M3169_14995 [Candidatus Eremiobacteraeota bacterium]|nr:hypothetical protein [Candidatus Eremiobacteraeota bacterium]
MSFGWPRTARGDDVVRSASLEIVRPIGDAYSERTTDGDAYPESLAVRAAINRGFYTVVLDYRRNVYQTENAGAGTLTRYARIEGGTGTAAPFLARESSFEARFERRLGHDGLAAGVGLLRTWANYNYPSLHGLGIGLEQRPSLGAGVRPFGSAFYFPSACGPYATETVPVRTLAPSFRILKLDYGVIVRAAHARVDFVVGYGNEFRRGIGLSGDNRFIRSDTYLGLGTHL